MEKFLEAVESSLSNKNWYSALVFSLILPDITGRIEYLEENSTAKRYSKWFERFVSDKYTVTIGADRKTHKFLSGDDCYALRCSLLHEGRDIIAHQRSQEILARFQFIEPTPGMIIHNNLLNNRLQLQVDIFCRDICKGVRSWLTAIEKDDEIRRSQLRELIRIQTTRDISGISIGA